MRPVTLDLDVVVSPVITDAAWPGEAQVIDFDDAACPTVDPDHPASWLVELVFVVMGYDSNQGDSVPAPVGWQVFSQEEAAPLIAGWLADGLEFHAATKITCSDDPENFFVVSQSYFDVVNAFNVCCGLPNIQTQAFSFKISNSPLVAGQDYPCGTAAAYRWLAIRGNNETRNLEYLFRLVLFSQDMATFLTFDLAVATLSATTQLQKSWPDDFIGLVSASGKTLVANSTETPGPDDVKMMTFDNGVARIIVQITDTDLAQVVDGSDMEWALPATQCGAGCISPYPNLVNLPGGTVGVPYNASIQLAGVGPWLFSAGNKPSWMTATLNTITGAVDLTGTPDDHVDDFEFIYTAANCGNALDVGTEHTLFLDIAQEFSIVAGADFSARNFSESIYAEFLGLFIMWVNSDDASGLRVATSPDGITWTIRSTAGFTGTINEAAVGVDRVLIIGTGTQGIFSLDGITWTPTTIPEAIQKFGLAYSPSLNLFVMTGQQGSNRIWTTVDGVTWNTIVAPVQNNWTNIAWSPELALFVAVSSNGTGNQVMTSPDGTTWTSQVSPTPTRSWNKINWLNGKFYACSQNGTEKLMTSPDGINWSLVNFGVPSFIATDIGYGNGLFLACTSSGGSTVFMSSENGTSWISRGSSPNQQWLAVNFAQALNRFSITGLGAGSGARVATVDWLP